MKRSNLSLTLLVVALGACAPTGSQESAELAAAAEVWAEAFNAGDIEAVAAMYTEDTRILPPNGEMALGRDVVRATFGGMADAGIKGELQPVEAMVAGDMGYRVGTYSLTGPDGSPIDSGKFIEIWKLVNGEWLITNDIWNSDSPQPNMLITHQVADASRWLAAWRGPESRRGMFAEHGAPSVRVFQSVDAPNLTALLVGVTDMDAFQALLNSPEGAAAKAEDGVRDPTIRVFTEVQ
jgi:ketosteroid isomerase-like protein